MTELLTVAPTNKHPFKIIFYRYAKPIVDLEEENLSEDGRLSSHSDAERGEKVLCIILGEVSEVASKLYKRPTGLQAFSEKLHQEKGQHIEALAKAVLTLK